MVNIPTGFIFLFAVDKMSQQVGARYYRFVWLHNFFPK
jgi:hypothetical protein